MALIQLNDQILFTVHTSGDESAQDRADLANLRLAEVLRGLFSERTSAQVPEATIGQQEGQTVLLLDQKLLMTVTDADVDASGKPAALLAQSWADQINNAFDQAVRERQPAYMHWALKQAAFYFFVGIVFTLGLQIAARHTHHRLGWPTPTLLWFIVIRQTVNLFPLTRSFYFHLVTGTLRPLVLCLIIGLPGAILVRLWGIALRKLFPAIPEDLSLQDRTERTYQRRITLARVAEVTGATILWTAAGVVLISWLGLNLSALLASAGLIGVALSIVAQDSLKDLVAGIYILMDDRFGVGDTVQIGAYEGRVERLNLRATQLRDMSGRLITISNRGIVDVANLTARWAQVDFKVGVSYYADLAQASKLLEDTAAALAEAWPERVLAPPEMLGVDSFTDLSVVLRLIIRTPPGDQWVVGRELRARVKAAFDGANIAILNNLYAPPPAPNRMPLAAETMEAAIPHPQAAEAPPTLSAGHGPDGSLRSSDHF
ncbi:MAG: mechanosensitive ion channel family protein [Janthinobacterium lividum]